MTLNIEYVYVPTERDFCLQADAVQGWNHTMPGPTISATQGDNVTLMLQAADNVHHQFYVDYDKDSFPDASDPRSTPIINTNVTFSFTASIVGNFTYYCAYNQETMFGTLQMNPAPHKSVQIGLDNVELASDQNATLTLSRNTTGLPYGNYTISAYAPPVPSETHTADNTLNSGFVIITIPGDIDSNFKVQLNDLVLLAHAYGSKAGDPNWNPNADIDGNGIVGLPDLVTLAQHYGQHYP